MNLKDLIGDEGLQQDEWSLTKPRFGAQGQLQVVGWCGKSSSNKLYILKCNICPEDSELFGEGYFKCLKSNISRGNLPCGCAQNTHWNKDQYGVICNRVALERNYKFLGFTGEWKGYATKLRLVCEKHGEWSTGTVNNFINHDKGCPKCGYDAIATSTRKPDDVMIQSFLNSRAFHPETKFWRSERLNTHGHRVYWHVYCPDCGENGEATGGSLRRGSRPCACSKNRQKVCYINWILEDGEVVAIKFGISNGVSNNRAQKQNSTSAYEVRLYNIYLFPRTNSCKQAERECKQQLECGVVLKRDMPDGYTETTWVYNLEKIIEIYERNGGVRQENP